MRFSTRHLRLALTAVIGLPLAYLATAALLGRIAVNADWRAPTTGVTIFVYDNGVHTGIVLPAGQGRWRAYGWGDRQFYLETPTWRDVRLTTVVAALAGSGRTVVHVDRFRTFLADENWRPLTLRAEEHRRLVAFIAASLAPGGRAVRGYGPDDAFYPAVGRYSAVRTCNVWTGNALRTAGVKMGVWTPFAGDVMRWVPYLPPALPSPPRR